MSFECVPNLSEGRDPSFVDECVRALEACRVRVANASRDPLHHRCVITYFGDRDAMLQAAVALARIARDRIDLRTHRGAHPRIGALDVLPFVPIGAATMADAVALAHDAARRIWEDVRVPCFFYGDAARVPERRRLADVRRGGFEALAERAAAGERADAGDVPFHPSAGAIAVGSRGVLVAFNLVLAGGSLALARRIARTIRERDGGLRTLRAIGIDLGDGRVQVSCNITDYEATPIALVVDLVRRIAARSGATVAETELIGLVPRAALVAVAARRIAMPVTPVELA